MKQLITISLTILLVFTITGCTVDEEYLNTVIDETNEQVETETLVIGDSDVTEYDTGSDDEEIDEDDQDNEYGSLGALTDDSFTLEEMLLYAIQDEYAARREYEYILDTFDVTKPFSNIISSEETHISLLIPLFISYNITLPDDTSQDHVISIASLEEAFDIGVIAEINNIDMYNIFLSQEDLPQDVYDVFVKLRDASLNHLSAFEKNAEKY